ncbi:hypothetical protein ACLOJK_033966 [Asimina triloba]
MLLGEGAEELLEKLGWLSKSQELLVSTRYQQLRNNIGWFKSSSVLLKGKAMLVALPFEVVHRVVWPKGSTSWRLRVEKRAALSRRVRKDFSKRARACYGLAKASKAGRKLLGRLACYCYICETKAPCKEWSGIAKGHCHASDHDPKWNLLKIKRGLERLLAQVRRQASNVAAIRRHASDVAANS